MKTIYLIFLGFFYCHMALGQLSFSETRLRDRTLNEGISSMIRGEYVMAEVRLSECLELDSTFAPAYFQRARIWLEWGEIEDALDDLDMALLLDPGMGEACFYKGYILYGSDTTGLDAELFDKAILNGFKDPWAYYFRAITRFREGLEGMAMNDLNTAIDLREDFALAYHERAGIKRLAGDLQGSHFDYQTALEYQPYFPLAYNNMGSVKMLLGDYQGAIADYTQALEQDPELAIALNNRGYALYYMGNMDAALQDFNEAIAVGDSMAIASLNKASLMAKQNKHELALQLLDGIVQNYPGEALLYLNRGLIRELTGDLNGACEDWNRAKELGSGDVDAYLKECNEL
jgi:tetratricopeptide (TPR) repeat protein